MLLLCLSSFLILKTGVRRSAIHCEILCLKIGHGFAIIAGMEETLYPLAKNYVGVIEKIEKTIDAKKLLSLEEKRVELHGRFMDLLKAQGINFKDRDHATRIAVRIANGEL